ncbi:28S ribosomal protein S27, mitochondrial, partial [Stegodyphus mimosarum]
MASVFRLNRYLFCNFYRMQYTVRRTILSEAYLCEDAWQRRFEDPLLKNINLAQYFVETDKKFGTKRLASGVDIDIFANCVQSESELDELEHLLYRFRRTKRAVEIMDSTIYATIKIYLKYKQYETLLKILEDRENYGIFPDLFSYNILMDTFLKEKLYKEAAHTAVLMMLQEDFRNKISCVLALYSCQMYLNECSLDSWYPPKEQQEEEVENENEDEEEVTLVRVPFIREPWFDDHFDITNPKHLIGKTFYLVGREMNDPLARTYQLLGLTMYEKWNKAAS